MDSFHAFFSAPPSGYDFFLKQEIGRHEEGKCVILQNMHLKQLSDCSHSESDKYTKIKQNEDCQRRMSFRRRKKVLRVVKS